MSVDQSTFLFEDYENLFGSAWAQCMAREQNPDQYSLSPLVDGKDITDWESMKPTTNYPYHMRDNKFDRALDASGYMYYSMGDVRMPLPLMEFDTLEFDYWTYMNDSTMFFQLWVDDTYYEYTGYTYYFYQTTMKYYYSSSTYTYYNTVHGYPTQGRFSQTFAPGEHDVMFRNFKAANET